MTRTQWILSALLMTAATVSFAKEVEIKLLKKPELTEEGIHLQTNKGQHALYAMNATANIWQAFGKAKKGQCLQLTTTADFDFDNADKIKKVSVVPCH